MLCFPEDCGTDSHYHRQGNDLYFKSIDIPNNK